MITITRSMARLVRAVIRRAFGSASRGPAQALVIESGTGGLFFKTRSHDMALEYRAPMHGPAENMAIPVELLQDCEGTNDEPVQLTQTEKGIIEATWQDGCIPQVKQYDVRKPEDVLKDFPTVPETLSENPLRLLQALKDAAETSNPNPLRYATSMLQLRGEPGSVGATDGHHLLLQRGFSFPWTEDLLIPASKLFASKELSAAETLYIGRTVDWISLVVGDWRLYFLIDKEGRFPHLDDHIRSAESATTTLQISDTDALFLDQALDRLPCNDEPFSPVTLDLNGQVIVRAKSLEHSRATELVLSGSKSSGDPVALAINRKFLGRAMRLGFREVLVYGNDKALQCRGDRRSYVWMPLSADDVVKPGIDPIRIESPAQEAKTISESKHQRTKLAMPRRKSSDFGVVPVNGTNSDAENLPAGGTASESAQSANNDGQAGEASLIDQAEAVRTSLRESMDKIGDLIGALKRHRKQSRLVASTLSSLRQLQSLDA